MEIMFEERTEEFAEGSKFEKVTMNVLDTGTLNPRTNKRKVRKYLVSVVGIAPNMVKKAMLDLDMVAIPRKNLRTMREWIKRHAPEVEVANINVAARLIKANPDHPIGIIDPKLRKVTQELQDAERDLAEAKAIDRALDADKAQTAERVRQLQVADDSEFVGQCFSPD